MLYEVITHNYVQTLREAIRCPHPDYARFPSGQGGDYQQLSDGLLQIENEFYSPIRPKRVARSAETPLHALTERGIDVITSYSIHYTKLYERRYARGTTPYSWNRRPR